MPREISPDDACSGYVLGFGTFHELSSDAPPRKKLPGTYPLMIESCLGKSRLMTLTVCTCLVLEPSSNFLPTPRRKKLPRTDQMQACSLFGRAGVCSSMVAQSTCKAAISTRTLLLMCVLASRTFLDSSSGAPRRKKFPGTDQNASMFLVWQGGGVYIYDGIVHVLSCNIYENTARWVRACF